MIWDISLSTIVTSSVTSGLIVLAITKGLEWQKRREEARLAVLYIVNQLESYASDCLDWLQDQRLEDFALKLAINEAHIDNFPRVPLLESFSPLVDWNAVGVDGVKEVFDFQIAVRSSHSASALRWSPYLPDALAKVKVYTARLGKEALELSAKLRSQWALAGMRSAVPEGSTTMFESIITEIEEERRAIERRTNSTSD